MYRAVMCIFYALDAESDRIELTQCVSRSTKVWGIYIDEKYRSKHIELTGSPRCQATARRKHKPTVCRVVFRTHSNSLLRV